MATATHYYEPERVAKTYGNRKACCTRPESEHPAFPVGKVTVQATRDIRTLSTIIPKGTVLEAEGRLDETYVERSPGRWGTNELGQFAEIEKAVWDKVLAPSWTIQGPGESHLTAIPVKWAKVV